MKDIDFIPLRAFQSSQYTILTKRDSGRGSAMFRHDNDSADPFLINHNSSRQQTIATQVLDDESPRAPKHGLPAKAYTQTSIWWRVGVHTTTILTFLISLAIPFITIFILGSFGLKAIASSQATFCSEILFNSSLTPDNSRTSTILDIHSAFGNYSYSTARLIDLLWDVIVSRCGQALLGWVSYKVYTAALMRIMETHPISYDLYISLTLSVRETPILPTHFEVQLLTSLLSSVPMLQPFSP